MDPVRYGGLNALQHAFRHIGPVILGHVFAMIQIHGAGLSLQETEQVAVERFRLDCHAVTAAHDDVILADRLQRRFQIVDEIAYLGAARRRVGSILP